MQQKIIVGSLATLALMFFGFLVHKQSRVYEMEPYLVARSSLSVRLDSIVGHKEVLRMAGRRTDLSLGNKMLGNCLFSRGICKVTNPDNQVDVAIPKGMDESSPLLTGTTFRPAIYSTTGKPSCQVNDPGCPGWEVVSSFWAECPSAAKSCEKAEQIHVRYQINPSKGFDWPTQPGSVPPVSEYKVNPTRFAKQIKLSRK